MLPKKWNLLLFLTSIIVLFYCAHSAGSYKENEVIKQAAECNKTCGINEKCGFEDGEQVCSCIDGYAKKDEVCTKCDKTCGIKEKCGFKDGEQVCSCIDGYAKKDEVCTSCNCGEGSRGCSFEDGMKSCHCRFKYFQKDGVCEACNCGEGGIFCSFKDGEKICRCKIGYANKDGVCVACNCGKASSGCSFKDGVKFCNCYLVHAQNKGVCEECNCGLFESGCSFKDGIKTCECIKGRAYKNGSCERCDCGNGTCFFKEDRKSCICDPGFVESDGYCKELPCEKECKNGGNCKKVNETSICVCISGTSGDFCENIDECLEKNTFCEARPGTECYFDVKERKADCKCIDGDLKFDERSMRCRSTCTYTYTDEGKICKNYGSCELSFFLTGKFCVCKKGTSGDYCETIAKCSDLDCGDKATCEYNEVAEDAYCKCKDGNKAFDLVDKCSVNYCKEKCKVEKGLFNENVECTGNVYEQEELKCKCREDHIEFNIDKGVCEAKAIAADNKTGAIVGGVVGTLLVIIFIVAAFILYRKLSKTKNDGYTRNRQRIALPEIFGGRKQ